MGTWVKKDQALINLAAAVCRQWAEDNKPVDELENAFVYAQAAYKLLEARQNIYKLSLQVDKEGRICTLHI